MHFVIFRNVDNNIVTEFETAKEAAVYIEGMLHYGDNVKIDDFIVIRGQRSVPRITTLCGMTGVEFRL